jgi:hypothetical protein
MGDLVETFGAGLQIGLEPQQVAEGLLRTVLDKNLLERNRLGVEQLRRHLAWDRVSEDYVKGYEHVLCGGTEPNSAPARFRRPRLPFEQAGR